MYLFSSIIVFQVLSTALSSETKMDGIVELDETFFNSLNNESNNIKKMYITNSVNVKPRVLPQKNIRFPSSSSAETKTADLKKYVEHMKNKGVTILQNTSKEIMKETTPETVLNVPIDAVIDNYVTKLQEYFRHTVNKKTNFAIDTEYMFLDMVEAACRLLNVGQKRLLNDIIALMNIGNDFNETAKQTFNKYSHINFNMNSNNTSKGDNITKNLNTSNDIRPTIMTITQVINQQVEKTRREELRHICYKYDVCRPYPALTDYLADFSVEILKLADEKLDTFVKFLNMLVSTNDAFFNSITEEHDRETVLIPQFLDIINNVNTVRETLLVVRGILTQRYKKINTPSWKLKTRTHAMRLLLDIINRAFQYENIDLIAIEFDTVTRDINNWNAGQRHFPESGLLTLLNHIISVLNYNWSKNAKLEVSVLIEIIIRGSSKHEDMYMDLLNYGSKFMKDENVRYLHYL